MSASDPKRTSVTTSGALAFAATMASLELGGGMRRRDFIALIGGAATWPGLAFAQQTRTRKRVGFIADAPLPPVKRFRETLQKLGWVEGENLIIEFRYSEGNYDRYSGFAAEL